MMNIRDVSQIMLLTDAVYESDTISTGQDVGSFKEIKDGFNPKRYIRFENTNAHSSYQKALRNHLRSIGDGSAVIETFISEEGDKSVFSDNGSKMAIIVDMSKIEDSGEEEVLVDIINNTITKMHFNTKSNKMRAGINKIKEAADEAKAGPGSRKVNALKEIIDKAAENVK